MRRSLLICPGYFNPRFDGIGRVTGAIADAMTELTGVPPRVWSANDPVGSCQPGEGRCFGQRYRAMVAAALFSARGELDPHQGSTDLLPLPLVCTHLGLSPVARILASRTKRPYQVFVHGVEAWKPFHGRTRWGIGRAQRILTNSHYTLRRFLAHNPWARSIPATVVPLGVPAKGLAGARSGCERAGLRESSAFSVLTVGRMAKAEYYEAFRDPADLYKGFKSIVSAVGALRSEGLDARLELVGDGNAREDLERWVVANGATCFVHFHGRVSDAELARHYEASDVFVLPSEGEGFGLVYAEAMAYALPCVAVQTGAAPEVVIDDEAGFVVRPRDTHQLVECLRVLARNATVYSRLSGGARRRYLEHYTQTLFIQRIRDALKVDVRGPTAGASRAA